MQGTEVESVKPTKESDDQAVPPEDSAVKGEPVQHDGGVVDDSPEAPFELVTSGQMSKRERYRLLFNDWVIAPLKILWNDWRARAGALILFGFILMGVASIITTHTRFTVVSEPVSGEGDPLVGAFQTLEHPLGTDNLGRDIFAQIVHSTPTMLEMILAGAIFTTVIAVVIGTLSGYKGGLTDQILMTLTDIFMTIPGLPLVIVVAVVLEPRSPWIVGIIVVINAWAGLARAIRSQVLTLREEAFVESSRIMGLPTSTILAKDITPGLMPYVMVNFVNTAREVIFASVGLYFIGVLPRTDVVNWGLMMQNAYETGGAIHSMTAAHWLLVPMATIVLMSFGLILLAQGTDRIFNPRVRARHASPTETEAEDSEVETTTTLQPHN